MVAAAAEAVVAPDLADVEAEAEIVGERVEEARQVARRRVVLAAQAAHRRAARSSPPCQRGPSEKTRTWASSQTPSEPQLLPMMSLLRLAIDLPALRPGIIGEDPAADQPLLLARQRRIDDRRREAVAREHPRRLDHRRGAGAVVIGARRVGGGVHRVGDPAVDMAGDDDDPVGIARCRAGWRRRSRPGSGSGCAGRSPCRDGPHDLEAAAAGARDSGRTPPRSSRSAAPMPRVGWSRADRVWRVPKPTSRSTVARSRSSDTSSAIARRLGGAAEASGAPDRCAPAAGTANRRRRERGAAFSCPDVCRRTVRVARPAGRR